MTTTTTNQMETSEVAAQKVTPKRKAGKCKAGKNPDNLTFPLMNGKRENVGYIHPDESKNPLQLIGGLIKQFTGKVLFFVDFPKNHIVCTIPAAGTYGEKERALIAHKNYLSAITADLERDAAITDKATLQKLGLYQSKGWKFTSFTKIGLITVAEAKVSEVSTSVNLVKSFVNNCPELKQIVENNNLRKVITAEINKNGIEAGLKLAKERAFKALPAIVK